MLNSLHHINPLITTHESRKWVNHLVFLIPLLLLNLKGISQQIYQRTNEDIWVDSIYNNLSIEERVGQLFMIRAHSDKGPDHIQSITRQIKKYNVGGLCFFQGTPTAQIKLVNQYQDLANIPLFISMDAEWGPAMRFSKNTVKYPRQLMLGAIQDNELIYDFGKEVARELKLVGTNINFAPVVDINNNPKNPVINDRSFGEDKYNVTAKGYMYMKGMQDHGILACAKHFPGHGDTDIDSHKELPVINHDMDRLKDIELYPFSALAKTDLAGVMIAHLNIPALDDRKNIPTTLSYNTVTNLLKDTLGFKGLIFTDALEMQGVSKYWPNGEVELKAFEAGNDLLLLPNDLGVAVEKLTNAVRNNEIDKSRLEHSVKKILRYKYKIGLNKKPSPLSAESIDKKLVSDTAVNLKRDLIKNAITLVRDQQELIPLEGGKEYINLALGISSDNPFQTNIRKFSGTRIIHLPDDSKFSNVRQAIDDYEKRPTYIISIHDMSRYDSRNFGISKNQIDFINGIAEENDVMLILFGSPYSAKFFDNIKTLVIGYNEDPFTQESVAEALFGKGQFRGKLPVTASPISPFNQGISTAMHKVLQFGLPESVGFEGRILNKKIDSLVELGMKEKAFPGCEILVAKNNYIVYQKSFGYHTYDHSREVNVNDLYDLASVTKIAAATMAVMKLFESGRISLDDPIGNYLPTAVGTNKANLTLRDIMAHRAGLKPWIPFYKETMEGGKIALPSRKYYRTERSDSFSIQVCDNLFIRNDYPDTIYQLILESPLRRSTNYKYSDLGFYLIAKIVENITGKNLDTFVKDEIYTPLGMHYTTFQPYNYFAKEAIVPTEVDHYFRNKLVHGFVHDMGAAMLDGISGHAGLFSNSKDLAILLQMLLNDGTYSGIQIFNPQTIETFTTRHPDDSRRAIGFDMKNLKASPKNTNVAALASDDTFGHYGFTGTAIWADPAYDLIYVFLSNRTYPNYPNRPNLLSLHNYRSKIQNVLYESLGLDKEIPDISQ